MLHMFKLSW